MSALDLANKLQAQFGALIAAPQEFRGEVTLTLADAESIV
jgi:hypothetical protein